MTAACNIEISYTFLN